MRRAFLVVAIFGTAWLCPTTAVPGDTSSGCYYGIYGTSVVCGGSFVIPSQPSTPAPPPAPHSTAPTTTIPLAYYVANGPNGPCLALGPANPAPNATVSAWLATVRYANCPATIGPAPPVLNPQTIAVHFWQTIPLPVPRPDVPPGYAITGKTAYLVTNGTTQPAPFTEHTPLGALTIRASGAYTVDWGDRDQNTGTPSRPAGPYPFEGRPYPDGRITHVYDVAGTYTITVTETWAATWSLAGARGTLAGLRTTATIAGFRAEQLQAVLTN